MGVLDDLKKEAKAMAAAKARETTEQAAARRRAREHLAPRMQALLNYFTELKNHLELVDREILASYDIQGVGPVTGLVQGNYRVAVERPEGQPEQVQKFSFRCVCSKSGSFQVNQGDAASATAYREYLRENGLQAKVRDTGGGSALFVVQASVPVAVAFAADHERMAIRLRVRNLTSFGLSRHTLALDQANEHFMDEVARAILRVDNRFDEIVGKSISHSKKRRLKKQIQAAMRKKELHDQLEMRKAERESTITHRLGRGLFSRKGG